MWTRDALRSSPASYAGDVWRMVETQYKAATLRLTDSLAEQALLERIIDATKPPMPPQCAGLDFLLATPFRYAPYPFASRFRRANQPSGVFYSSEAVEAAVAETAFLRLLFLAEAPATRFPSRPVEHTAFCVGCRTSRHIDLTKPPFDRDRAVWAHPNRYGPCQELADAARAADIEIIRYQSVRDPQRRANVALLTPRAFADLAPKLRQTWHVFPRRHVVQAWCESPPADLEFPTAFFAVDSRLAPLFA